MEDFVVAETVTKSFVIILEKAADVSSTTKGGGVS
jgi:hypothetical protein